MTKTAKAILTVCGIGAAGYAVLLTAAGIVFAVEWDADSKMTLLHIRLA